MGRKDNCRSQHVESKRPHPRTVVRQKKRALQDLYDRIERLRGGAAWDRNAGNTRVRNLMVNAGNSCVGQIAYLNTAIENAQDELVIEQGRQAGGLGNQPAMAVANRVLEIAGVVLEVAAAAEAAEPVEAVEAAEAASDDLVEASAEDNEGDSFVGSLSVLDVAPTPPPTTL